MTPRERDDVQLAVLRTDMNYVKSKLDSIEDKVGQNYVSKAEFDPVKRIVYGLVSIILIGVGGALISLIIK